MQHIPDAAGACRRGPTLARVAAQPVPAASAIKLDGELTEEVWQKAPVVSRFPAARSERRRSGHLRDRGARRVRRERALHRRPGDRSRARQHRRHPHPPRRTLAVGLDSRDGRLVPRSPQRLRVRRQSRRGQSRTPTGSTTATTIRAGTRCGTWRSAATTAAGARSFGFRSPSCAFTAVAERRSGSPSSGRSAGSTKRRPGRCCAKSATGYVSSFGELTGLQIGRAPKRLELVPYVVGDVKTQPVEAGNPLQDARSAGAEVGRRSASTR